MPNRYVLDVAPDLSIPTADPALLEAAAERKLTLFWGGRAPTRALLAALTVVAVRGGGPASESQNPAQNGAPAPEKENVRVFDGGNCFDGYYIARLTRRLTAQPYTALERVRLSRAFTCFQLAELIENAADDPEPLFVLDFLATFYDESVPLRDVERLLDRTITHLKRLANAAPVLVGAAEPRSLVKERWSLLDQIQTAADAAWMMLPPQENTPQQQMLLPETASISNSASQRGPRPPGPLPLVGAGDRRGGLRSSVSDPQSSSPAFGGVSGLRPPISS